MDKAQVNKFTDAFMEAFPDHLEDVPADDLTHPQALLGIDLGSTSFCDLWKKYEPQVERALGLLKFFGWGGVAAFILAILAGFKASMLPQICPAVAPAVKSNISQKPS